MTDLLASAGTYLAHNPLLAGMGGAAMVGGMMAKLRTAPAKAGGLFLRMTTVTARVHSTDPIFPVIDRWLARHPHSQKTRIIEIKSQRVDSDDRHSGDNHEGFLTAGSGTHLFRWRKRWLKVSRETGDTHEGRLKETITITALGRSQQIIRDILEDAQAQERSINVAQIRIWRHWWQVSRGRSPRPIDTLTYSAGLVESVIDDMTWFAESRSWYQVRGIPYRRGYLFAGDPGTGKSSLVLAIGGYFNRPICILNIASLENDDELMKAIEQAPNNGIILIEDIDCIGSSHKRTEDDDDEAKVGVTTGGLLNALDGLTTPDGRIFIMTTNHPATLDPALVRPGRADRRFNIGGLSPADQIRMAARFYDRQDFVPVNHLVPPAFLQAAFMQHPDNPELAREVLCSDSANESDHLPAQPLELTERDPR